MSWLAWIAVIVFGAVLVVSAAHLFIWLWLVADAWRHPREWID